MPKGRKTEDGYIFKRGIVYYLQYNVRGKRKIVSLKETTKEEAEKKAKKLTEIARADTKEKIAACVAVHVAEARKLRKCSMVKIADAWATYLRLDGHRPDSAPTTLKGYRKAFDLFHRWIAAERPDMERLSDIDADTANAYFSALAASGVSSRTFNAYLQAIKLLFAVMVKAGLLEESPFAAVKKRTQESASRKEFTEAQITEIFDGFDSGFFFETEVEQLAAGRTRERKVVTLTYEPMNKPQMKTLLMLCCWTGCRGQDGCLMEWGAVDFPNNRITYTPIKTARKAKGRCVTIPIHPGLRAELLAARQWSAANAKGESYILPAVAARYKANPSGVQKDVMQIIRCATGLATTASKSPGRRKQAANSYSLHSFRHSFVSFCANSGVPLAVVAEIVGHGNPAMTRHYSHISDKAKAEAIGSLPTLATGQTTRGSAALPPARPPLQPHVREALESMDAGNWEEIKKQLLEG